MPAKIRPGDWDRLFAPNAPRRGGPLRTLINMLVAIVIMTLLGAGGIYAFRYRANQIAAASATATAVAPTIVAIQTQTAQAEAQAATARVAQRTATAIAREPTPEPSLGTGVVVNGGNLRKEAPRGEVIGLIWAGDQVTFLQQQQVGGQTWFRIRLTKPAPDRGGQGVAAGVEGWASATLLSQPTPATAP